ncbi:hypothetical protein BgAZ_108950 [Babesia gibsoni]|uniref:Uncharacterized protein n=1 Tax=Babesia gibsoni TaxID=33632 RepID=A0AAD8UWI9_BABGI|nr:hypothetical protein BgAZ_108950 [Babesia gibsoni]
MGARNRDDLRQALSLRLGSLVHDADIANCRASFNGCSAVYPTSQLYSFFNLSGVDLSNAEKVTAILDRDLLESIRLLESTEPADLRLVEIYPLMRRIVIIMEGFLNYVGKSMRFEGTMPHNYVLPLLTVYDVLDGLYDDTFGSHIGNESLIRDLSSIFNDVKRGLDSILISISGFVNLMVPIISNSFETQQEESLEYVVAVFTFGALQRISAHFLLLAVADRGLNGSVKPSQESQGQLLELSAEDISDENMYRVDFLCKETLCKSLVKPLTEFYMAYSWQEDIVEPILSMLNHTFLLSPKIIAAKVALSDIVVSTTLGFLSKTPGDFNPPLKTLQKMARFGQHLINMFVERVEDLNKALWSYFEMQLMHVLKVQSPCSTNASGTPRLTVTSVFDNRANGHSLPISPSFAPPSRSLSTMLSATELQNRFTDFLSFVEYHSKRYGELFDVLFEVTNMECGVPLVECLSKLFAHFSALVQLGDALLYITKRSPKAEILENFKHTITSMWTLLRAFGKRVPFDLLKACFYNLGSDIHSRNVAAQISCFNVAIQDIAALKDAYNTHHQRYNDCVDMLRSLLKGCSNTCSTCVSYRQSKPQRFSTQFLTVPSSFIGRWFVMETLVGASSERKGLLDAFAEWCHSSQVEEYMLARYMCRLLSRLAKADKHFMSSARYVLDILLGLCLHSENKGLGVKTVLRPFSPSRRNMFRCLSVFLENGVFTEWILKTVVLPCTCVVTNDVAKFTNNFPSENVQNIQNTFECYFSKSNRQCRCLTAPIANEHISASHFLHLLEALPWHCYVSTNEDSSSLMFRHVLVVLCGMLGKLVQFLHANKNSGDIQSRFAIFVLAAKVASVLVASGNFGRKNNQVVLILKLYSLLGNQKICMPEEAGLYLSLILQALCVFHSIFDHVPVKDQLMKLHNGFLALLQSKIHNYPHLLLRYELYKDIPSALIGQLSGYFPNLLRQSKCSGHYLWSLYNFKVWMVCDDYKIDREEVKQQYIEQSLNTQDEPPEFRITLNTAFILSCRIASLSRGVSIHSLVEHGSCVGIYGKQ